ncbi:MAG: cupin domain-containing protein [Oscillospiraceae bacterium]|nr:cupin domain-containing protein [Oscillospiraceae bacterium]
MITVRKPTPQEAEQMQSLPTWGCEPSEFKWSYNDKETCLLIKGKVKVTYEGGETEFGAGDLVTFEKGLQCVWKVTEEVEKFYKFG